VNPAHLLDRKIPDIELGVEPLINKMAKSVVKPQYAKAVVDSFNGRCADDPVDSRRWSAADDDSHDRLSHFLSLV
jgi:hypothetical protein